MIDDCDHDHDDVEVQATSDFGGYWSEIKLVAQMATQMMIGSQHTITAADAAQAAHEVLVAARGMVDVECDLIDARMRAASAQGEAS